MGCAKVNGALTIRSDPPFYFFGGQGGGSYGGRWSEGAGAQNRLHNPRPPAPCSVPFFCLDPFSVKERQVCFFGFLFGEEAFSAEDELQCFLRRDNNALLSL